jgi:magnesium transporter
MTTRIPVFFWSASVGSVVAYLDEYAHLFDTVNYVYVVTRSGVLKGVISIKELFTAEPQTALRKLIEDQKVYSVYPQDSVVLAAQRATRHSFKAMPVTSREGELLGVVQADTVQSSLMQSYADVLKNIGGIARSEDDYDNIIETPLFVLYKNRVPWLLLGMVGGIFLASIIGFFEHAVQKNIMVVGFIPVITYVSNAVAIQAQMVFIRDLALHNMKEVRGYMIRHFEVSASVASTVAVCLVLTAMLGWADAYFLLIVGVALFLASMFAVLFALMVPFGLKRLGYDPGIASGPFSTIIQDISSIVIYFTIIQMLL